MAKNVTIASYDIDIRNIEKKISELRAGLNADALGEGLTKKLSKEISQLETQLDKVKNAYPGAGASQKQIDSYNKKMENLRISISSFGKSAIDSFDDSDNYIKKNIKSLQDYVNKVGEANKELKKLKEGQDVPKLNVSTNIGKAEEAEKAMRAAAKKGNRQGVLNAYATYSSVQNAELRNLAKTEGKDSEKYQIALRDREHVHEIEKAYVKMAETVLKATQALEQAQKEETNAILEARNAQKDAFSETITGSNAAEDAVKGCQVQIEQWAQATKEADEASKRFTDIESRIKNLFSAGMAIQTVQRIVRNAIKDFQELDKQFNEIAIVSDYSTQEMWKSFSTVNKVAQEFGVTTKNVLEVQNLYYHQGKDMAEVNKLTAQTLTLAKITGMDYEKATSDLTAALNAYNIAAEDAVRVTDTIAAMDTNAAISSEELMTALTKTASIAANAGMSLESTEVFLTKMIETTREAPENLGTALKTIIARFGEVKQEIDGEEIELADINRVDTALKSIGISLLDTAGQIRDLDDVFMELSSKWDDLDRNTQRYIATMAAGSRQQSRFIAMMEDYDRTLELTEIAQDSAGIGARQLAESMDSMETSINRLKSTWQEFYASLISAGAIKGVIDIANGFLTVLNKLPAPLNLVAAGLMLWGAKVLIVDKGLKALGTAMGQEVAAAGGVKTSQELMIASLTDAQIALQLESETLEENTRQLLLNEQARRQLAKENNTKRKIKKVKLKKVEEKYQVIPDSNWNKIKNSWRTGKKDSLGEVKSWKDILNSQNPLRQGLTKSFKNSVKNMKNTVPLKGRIKELAKGKVMGVITKAMPVLTKIATTLPKIITFITQLINPITVLIAVTAGAFAIYRREMGQTLDDTKNIEKLEKAQEKYNNSLKEYNNLQENAKTYEKYRNRKNLSEEELQEQQEAAKALIDEYPSLLDRIDEEGKYHLKNAEEIQKEISAKEELLDINAKQYAQLRLKYAEEGLYTDETTKAGQSMKNLQDYANTLEKDALKNLARGVDKTLNLNKSRYYDAMEAYASGEKSSFGYKEFSDWFAGDIGKDNWNELLEAIKDIDLDNMTSDELSRTLANELNNTGAYLDGATAQKAAEAFVELNDQMGGILGTLLEGAAQEYSEIEIMQASLVINKADFQWDAGANLTEAMSAAAKERAEARPGYKYASEKRQAEMVKEEAGLIADSWEEITKLTGQKVEKVFSDEAMGGLAFAKVEAFNVDADTDKAKRDAVLSFYNELENDLQILPEDFIKNSTQEVIDVLFERIKKGIQGIDEEALNNIWSDYITSVSMYKKSNFNMDESSFNKMIDSMSVDQVNALQEKIASLSMEQQAPYLSALMSGRSKIKDLDQQNDFINEFLKIDFTNIYTASQTATKALEKFGINGTKAMQQVIDAAGGVNNISFGTMEDTLSYAENTVERVTTGLEGMTALLEGKGTISQVKAYQDTMVNLWKIQGLEDSQIQANLATLNSSIIATGEGFKISAEDGKEYGQTLTKVTKESINSAIASLQLRMAVEGVTEAEKVLLQQQINMLTQLSAQIDAAEKQAYYSGLEDSLTKAKEAADDLLEAMKGLVTWLREYDRYSNLDGVIESLEQDFDHLDFELNFTTNTKVVEKDLEEKISNINTRIAANQGGIRAAEEDQLMWRDVIQKRNAEYITFDTEGNAIVNAQKLKKLQEEIADTDKEHRPILQAKYDEIMDNVEAYNKAKDKVEDYTSALEENFSELKEVLSETYESVIKVEEKLIKVRQEAEDRELEALKKRYDAIKEEDNKYLDSVRKMVEEERKIRDRANKEEDVRDKEKKLAMMKMDTSGIYKGSIQSLEKELEQDYQDLEDDAIDRALDDLEKRFNAEAEALDKEVQYLENALDYKREKMTEYNEWANQLLMDGSDAVLAYLQANDQEYYTGTAAAKAAWSLEWDNAVAQAVGANQMMQGSLLNTVYNALEACSDAAGGFEQAVEQYSETAIADNGSVQDSVYNLTEYYYSLAEGVGSVESALSGLAGAYRNAASAAAALAAAQAGVTGSVETIGDLTNSGGDLTNPSGAKNGYFGKYTDSDDEIVQAWKKENYQRDRRKDAEMGTGAFEGMKMVPFTYTPNGQEVWFWEKDLDSNGKPVFGAMWYKKYATGGLADYTGPAWLDGTPSKPEAVLNPLQTKYFIQFTNILDSLFSNASLPNTTSQPSQKSGDTQYNFTITVDQMANDYDVDKLIARIEDKMVKASQYRNINIIKKSK